MAPKPTDLKLRLTPKKDKVAPPPPPPPPPPKPDVDKETEDAYNRVDEMHFANLGDYDPTETKENPMSMVDIANKLERAGFNERNGSNLGSTSNNAIFMAGERLGKYKNIEDMKRNESGQTKAMQYASDLISNAKKAGINSGAELLSRKDELLRKTYGPDYEIIEKNYVYPNMASAAARILDEKQSTFVPAKEKYDYDKSTKTFKKKEQKAPATPLTDAQQRAVKAGNDLLGERIGPPAPTGALPAAAQQKRNSNK